jgi:hypothetical protein
MNGLIIRSPWVEMIVEGKKTWEIRGRDTRIRDWIALIRGGSGLIVGTCSLVDVVGPLTLWELQENAQKAGLERSEIYAKPYTKTYAWVLNNVSKLIPTRLYEHPAGAVIWVRLPSF